MHRYNGYNEERQILHLRKAAGVQFTQFQLTCIGTGSSGDLKSCQVCKTESFGFKGGCGMHVAKHLKEVHAFAIN